MANKPQGFVEIPGWGNKYLINKYADVFNTDRGILMKPHLAKHGYYMITLCDKGIFATQVGCNDVYQKPKRLSTGKPQR